jgi:hypothetical protein
MIRMPLYWYTDKPIGKYRLKKPLPVSFEFEYDDSHLECLGDRGLIFDPESIKAEEQLDDIINFRYPLNIYGEPYFVENFQSFRKKLMEYLEEI